MVSHPKHVLGGGDARNEDGPPALLRVNGTLVLTIVERVGGLHDLTSNSMMLVPMTARLFHNTNSAFEPMDARV